MYPHLLRALRIAMPAATGPAAIIIPTVLYVIACRKVSISIS